ncbi:MAC/Perforin domain-containing protein [Annulohypoxylon bovei var. microspora]|nr:MAC/Perforin domain-containing protein [Annulohypoxylon bovei var. microspora]
MANNQGRKPGLRGWAQAPTRSELLRLDSVFDENTLPGVSVIGAGYDPFAGYASSHHVVDTSIFNWKDAEQDTFTYLGKTYNKPAAVNAIEYSDFLSKNVVGTDIQSYQEKLSTSVKVDGSYGFFSGSISTEFGSESLTKSECEFSRFQKSIGTWALELAFNSKIRDLLSETFRNDIDGLDTSDLNACERFFKLYGSHILTGIVLGGRALRTASTNKYTVDTKYDLSVTAEEAFKFEAAHVSAEERAQYSSAVSSFNSNSSTTRTTVGGNPQLGNDVFAGENSTFTEWSKSVIDDPVFVEFTVNNPFTPIWDLCANDGNGEKVSSGLSTYYEEHWAPEYADRLRIRPDYIDSLTFVNGDSSTISPTPGYQKIDYDLNSTVGGDYIYLCYHKASYNSLGSNNRAITDLTVIFDQESTPYGYTKMSTDLNAGAKGKYVYLCYKTSDYDSDEAILDIRVFGGKSYDVAPPYGFTKIERDLNAGAGGDYIFFGYAKRVI